MRHLRREPASLLTFSRVAKTCAWGMNQSRGRSEGVQFDSNAHLGGSVHVDLFDVEVGVFEVVGESGRRSAACFQPSLPNELRIFIKPRMRLSVAQKMGVAVDEN